MEGIVAGQTTIDRDALLRRCRSENTVVEAGAGFGKSVLLQLASQRSGFTLTHSTNEVLEAMAASATLIAIDDVDRWDEADRIELNSVVGSAADTTWLLAARSLPQQLTAVRTWARIETDDMRLNGDQVEQCLGEELSQIPALVDAVYELTSGWPEAVKAVAAQMQEEHPAVVARTLSRHNVTVETLVERLLEPQSVLDAARIVATLPQFDDQVASLVGVPDLIARLLRAGVPAQTRDTGWTILGEPARKTLRSHRDRGPLPARVPQYFLERQEIHTAIDTHLAYGDLSGAAELLSGLNLQQEVHLDPDKLHASVAAMGPAIDEYPRAHFVYARIGAINGHFDQSRRAVERGAEIFAGLDPSMAIPGHIETATMLGTWRVFDGRLGEAKTVIDQVVAREDKLTSIERAMLHDLRGLFHHALATLPDLEVATRELTAAYSLWRELNETKAATVTLFRLAGGVLPSRGLYTEALAMLEDLPSLAPMTLATTTRLALERATLLPYVGRADEVADEIAEATRVSKLLGDEWSIAQGLVTAAIAASILDEGDRVVEIRDRLISEGLVKLELVTEGLWWVDMADALARCQRWTDAAEALEALSAINDMPEWVVLYSSASIESRCGDPAVALGLLEELELRDDVEDDKRWLLQLYAATAQLRAGRDDEAQKLLDAAQNTARDLGSPDIVSMLERRLVDAIANGGGAGMHHHQTRLQLFGAFRVTRGRDELAVPGGNASTLLKLLGSAEGRLNVDQVIDGLWPDVSLDVGRRRLRNVVLRVRDACGDVIQRDGDMLALAANVHSDFASASMAATRLLASEQSSIEEAVAAIRLLDQPLLDEDRYEDWAEQARDRQRNLLVHLHDQAARAATDHDRAAALRHYQQAGDLDLTESAARRRAIADLTD